MIIDERSYEHFLSLYKSIDSNLNKYTLLYLDKTSLEIAKDKIQDYVPKTYRKKVEKIIEYLLERYDELDTVHSGMNEKVNEIVRRYFESRSGLSREREEEIIKDAMWLEKYLVLEGKYTNKNGRKVFGYVILPTEDELEKFEVDENQLNIVISNFLRGMYKSHSKIDDINRVLTLLGKKYRLTDKEYLKVLDTLGENEKKSKYLLMR